MEKEKVIWEYRVDTSSGGLSKLVLDEYGRQGWELVSEIIHRDCVRAVFKRIKIGG